MYNNVPNWSGEPEIQTPATIGELYITPDPPDVRENPSIGIIGGNLIPLPTVYESLHVGNLTCDNPPIDVRTWSNYPATSNIIGENNEIGIPKWSIDKINNIDCFNLTAHPSILVPGGNITGTVITGYTGNFNTVNAEELNVTGPTVLDGGTFHGTSIGSLPVADINTVRLDVLPAGIFMTSALLPIEIAAGSTCGISSGAETTIVAGGFVDIAAGDYVQINTADVYCVNTTSGNDATTLSVGTIHAGDEGTKPLRLDGQAQGTILSNGLSVSTNVANIPSYISIDAWIATTPYSSTVPDIVRYNDLSYQCLINSTGVNPVDGAQVWVENKPYIAGNFSILIIVPPVITTFKCILAVTSDVPPMDDSTHWVEYASGLPILPDAFWEPLDKCNAGVKWFPETGRATSIYSIVKPAGTGDGLYIAEQDSVTQNLIRQGLLYDSVINPPPPFTVTGNLDMLGHDIVNIGTAYATNVNSTNVTTSNIIGSAGTINMTSNVDLINHDLKTTGYVKASHLSTSTGTGTLGVETDMSLGTKSLTAANVFSTNNYTVNLSNPSGTLNLNSNVLASSKSISGVSTYYGNALSVADTSTNTITGTGGGTLYVQSNMDHGTHDITNITNTDTVNLKTDVITPHTSGGNITLTAGDHVVSNTSLDMTNHPIDRVTTITTQGIAAGISGVKILVTGGMNINSNDLTNVANLNVGVIGSQFSSYPVTFVNDVTTGNNILTAKYLHTDFVSADTGITAIANRTDVTGNLNSTATITAGTSMVTPTISSATGTLTSTSNLALGTHNLTSASIGATSGNLLVNSNLDLQGHDIINAGSIAYTTVDTVNLKVDNIGPHTINGAINLTALRLNCNNPLDMNTNAIDNVTQLTAQTLYSGVSTTKINVNSGLNLTSHDISNVANAYIGGIYAQNPSLGIVVANNITTGNNVLTAKYLHTDYITADTGLTTFSTPVLVNNNIESSNTIRAGLLVITPTINSNTGTITSTSDLTLGPHSLTTTGISGTSGADIAMNNDLNMNNHTFSNLQRLFLHGINSASPSTIRLFRSGSTSESIRIEVDDTAGAGNISSSYTDLNVSSAHDLNLNAQNDVNINAPVGYINLNNAVNVNANTNMGSYGLTLRSIAGTGGAAILVGTNIDMQNQTFNGLQTIALEGIDPGNPANLRLFKSGNTVESLRLAVDDTVGVSNISSSFADLNVSSGHNLNLNADIDVTINSNNGSEIIGTINLNGNVNCSGIVTTQPSLQINGTDGISPALLINAVDNIGGTPNFTMRVDNDTHDTVWASTNDIRLEIEGNFNIQSPTQFNNTVAGTQITLNGLNEDSQAALILNTSSNYGGDPPNFRLQADETSQNTLLIASESMNIQTLGTGSYINLIGNVNIQENLVTGPIEIDASVDRTASITLNSSSTTSPATCVLTVNEVGDIYMVNQSILNLDGGLTLTGHTQVLQAQTVRIENITSTASVIDVTSPFNMGNNTITNIDYTSNHGIRQPLIQYGTSNTGSTSTTVTLPLAYASSTSYIVQLTYKGTFTGNQPLYTISQTASTFTFHGANSADVVWSTMGQV